MKTAYNLNKFLKAQETTYRDALSEIKNGKKESHWMWYVFPQIKGLGFSTNSMFYGIDDLEEAQQYLNDPILGKRLIEISNCLLKVEDKTALTIFGKPDDIKLKSSMTLFSLLINTDPVFQEVLDKYFSGNKDQKTIQILKKV
jgi:uncharacterized protein (DUF1810 family)